MHYFPSNMPILDDRLTQAWEGSWLRKCFAHSPTPSHIPWEKTVRLFGVTRVQWANFGLWKLLEQRTKFFMDASISLKFITIKDICIYVYVCACVYICTCICTSIHTHTCTCMCVCVCTRTSIHIHTCTYMCMCVYTHIWQAVSKSVGHILKGRTTNLVRHLIPFPWLALILYSSFYFLRIWDSKVLLPCSPARFLTPPALLFSLTELQCSRGKWGLN